MQHAPSAPLAANMIKQEPRDDRDVQAPVFYAPWLDAPPLFAQDDFLSPFVDLVGDAMMDETTMTMTMAAPWSARRPYDDDGSLGALLCDEDALDEYAGMASPVAPSDMLLGVHYRLAPRRASPKHKPVSPEWAAARLHDTMGPSLMSAVLETTTTPTTACSSHGCKHSAVDASGRCARHTGGRLCKAPGCTKNTQSHGLCIRHGGGRRCTVDGCPRGAQARGKCKTHGGGVRCKVPGCVRSSQGSGLCRTHGGGKLCDYPGCKKGTQRHGKCSTHGGSRRCHVDGCDKVDRGGGLCGRHKAQATKACEDDDSGVGSFFEEDEPDEDEHSAFV